MEATFALPHPLDAPADLPPPLVGAVATKPKAQRCLGLASPPRPAAAASIVDPAASGGKAAAASTVPRASEAPSGKSRRPPCDPSASAPRKRPAARKTTPPAPVRPPAASMEQFPAPAASMEPLLAPATWMEPEASSPAAVATSALLVLDEIPPSMDNETFMNYTCGAAPEIPSQEYTQEDGEGEGDGEGFVEATPRRGRGTNFSQKEDQTLCNAWRRISIDSVVGNEQQSSTYWDRFHELYKLLLKGDMPRTTGSLQHRFHTINTDCFKWSCCLAQVDRINPSGTNPVDKQNIAQNMFMGKPKKRRGKLVPGRPFTLFHCWTILENDEKWKSRPSNEIPNKRKAPSRSVGEGFVVDTDDDGSSNEDGTPLSSVNRGRPEGRKKAKNKRVNGYEEGYKQSLDNMMEVKKDIAMQRREIKSKELEERGAIEERRVAAEERRAAAEERRVEVQERKVAAEEMAKSMEREQKIMFMDPSGLDEKARAYLELCRDQILASRGYFPNNGGNGGSGI
uniref:Uncharacterized protein n=1 Tax=Avena sativa TaxID=4498 RepID=A0ACD5VGR4_AVESA